MSKFMAGDIVQIRNGGRYRVIGLGADSSKGIPLYIYRNVANDDLVVSGKEEMEDGRFELVFRPIGFQAEQLGRGD